MAAGATTITYGSVKLLNCQTLLYRQEMVNDESDTDLLYFKTTIRVVGWLHGRSYNPDSPPPSAWNPTVPTFPTPGDGSAGHHHSSIRYLFAHRQAFEMRMGAVFDGSGNISEGWPILSCAPFQSSSDYKAASNKDVNNGPKAKLIDVTQVAGDTSLRIEVEFEICKVECDSFGSCNNTSGVLNNRWSCIDEIDRNFYTTRTFRGMLRTVSSKINANSFRNFVVPPLQPGMRRESMDFAVSTDGLTLAYTVVDREVAFSPPKPATTWRMAHSESIQREGERGFYSEVSITLGGDRNCDKTLLISIAAAIVEAKVLKALNKNAVFLQSIVVTDEYSDDTNLIHFHAKGRRVEKAEAAMGVATARLGRPIDNKDLKNLVDDYDSRFSRGNRPGDKIEVQGPISLVGAFAAYLQQPCSNQHKIFDAADATEAPTPGGTPSSTVTATEFSTIPDDGTLTSYSEATASAFYTFYQMESTYRTDGIRTHLPFAAEKVSSGINPTSTFIQLGPSMTQRVIRVTAERVGQPPEIANPAESFTDDNGILNVLLTRNVMEAVPERTADDKRLFRQSAELVYGMNQSPPKDSIIRAGGAPWENYGGIYKRVFKEIPETGITTATA